MTPAPNARCGSLRNLDTLAHDAGSVRAEPVSTAASRGFFLTEAVPKQIISLSAAGQIGIPLCHTDMRVLSGSVPEYGITERHPHELLKLVNPLRLGQRHSPSR
jgi:hypothetical protein